MFIYFAVISIQLKKSKKIKAKKWTKKKREKKNQSPHQFIFLISITCLCHCVTVSVFYYLLFPICNAHLGLLLMNLFVCGNLPVHNSAIPMISQKVQGG